MIVPWGIILVNCRRFGAGHFDNEPPRLNQFDTLDQVSLTDLALLEAGNSGQEGAAVGDVVVHQRLQRGEAGKSNAVGIALFSQVYPVAL
jgi:hypothetical protein